MSSIKVGFIGLGNMGIAMARCLPKNGLPVTVYDLRKEALIGALLDRLTHRCHILEMKGDSYRKVASSGVYLELFMEQPSS